MLAPKTMVTTITPTQTKSSHLGFTAVNTFESIAHLAASHKQALGHTYLYEII